MIECKTPQELAEITIRQYKEMLDDTLSRFSFDPALYDGYLEKFNAVFKMFKHGLIFSFDIKEYVKQLLLLDSSFERAVKEAALDFPEHKL